MFIDGGVLWVSQLPVVKMAQRRTYENQPSEILPVLLGSHWEVARKRVCLALNFFAGAHPEV